MSRLLLTLALTALVTVSCATGGKKMNPVTGDYAPFHQKYADVMSNMPGAREVRCPALAGPALDYRYTSCFFYPFSTTTESVRQSLTANGFTLKSGGGGPNAVRVYAAEGGDHFISQAELPVEGGNVLVGSLIAETGMYAGQREEGDPYLELSLQKAAEQVAIQLARARTDLTPCKVTAEGQACLNVTDHAAFLNDLAQEFYAGDKDNFLKKYRSGPFTYQGDELWKPADDVYGSVTMAYSKNGDSDEFKVTDIQRYRNMVFTVSLKRMAAKVTARYRPGYQPKEQ